MDFFIFIAYAVGLGLACITFAGVALLAAELWGVLMRHLNLRRARRVFRR